MAQMTFEVRVQLTLDRQDDEGESAPLPPGADDAIKVVDLALRTLRESGLLREVGEDTGNRVSIQWYQVVQAKVD